MPSFVARVRRVSIILVAGPIFISGFYAASFLGRWLNSQLTAPGFIFGEFHPISVILPENTTPSEIKARYAAAAAHSLEEERARGSTGLLLGALGIGAGVALLITSSRAGNGRGRSQHLCPHLAATLASF